MESTRRHFLGALSWPAAAAILATGASPRLLAAATEAGRSVRAPVGASPDEVARDESFWWHVQQAFTPDRSIINLNHGGVSPAPAVVQEAMKRTSTSRTRRPPTSSGSCSSRGRRRCAPGMAVLFGCDPEEIALTRNASESLQILQCGLPRSGAGTRW